MKLMFSVLAALLFLTTFALAQPAEPFPQAANPSVQDGQRYLPLVVEQQGYQAGEPASMAENAGEEVTPSVLNWSHNSETGTPFPLSAGPRISSDDQAATGDEQLNGGSPFPMSANPGGEE